MLSAGHGGGDVFALGDASGSGKSAIVQHLAGAVPDLASGGNTHGSGGGSLSPSGPGYPSPPALGPALRGDTRALFSPSPLFVNLQGSDVAAVPSLAAAPAAPGHSAPAGDPLIAPAKCDIVTGVPAETVTARTVADDSMPLRKSTTEQRAENLRAGAVASASAESIKAVYSVRGSLAQVDELRQVRNDKAEFLAARADAVGVALAPRETQPTAAPISVQSDTASTPVAAAQGDTSRTELAWSVAALAILADLRTRRKLQTASASVVLPAGY